MQTLSSIHLIAQRLAAAASSPAKVMLFGSYARGDAREDSDIDLLVIEKEISDKDEEYFKLFSAVRSANVDLILMQEADYLARAGSAGSLPHRVCTEGVVLHGG
jgi:uncharacterized protein